MAAIDIRFMMFLRGLVTASRPPATFHPPTCAASLVTRCALCSSVLSKQIDFLVYCERMDGYLCAIGRHASAKYNGAALAG